MLIVLNNVKGAASCQRAGLRLAICRSSNGLSSLQLNVVYFFGCLLLHRQSVKWLVISKESKKTNQPNKWENTCPHGRIGDHLQDCTVRGDDNGDRRYGLPFRHQTTRPLTQDPPLLLVRMPDSPCHPRTSV
eukprot:GHVN01106663.1.p1 GENE.GHVN01106663.1~~GHVN01106663.1.p1  ORF type:complete len:132 (+),score=6.75 GHVN01106663.1:574-969(+)